MGESVEVGTTPEMSVSASASIPASASPDGSEVGSASGPAGRLFARRRRANAVGGRQHHHKVMVTPEEEGTLARLALAQRVTIPRLLVESALSAQTSETPTERRNALAELFAVHRLLAAISNNVNQIARATNATGEVGEDLAATLRAVRRTAERIDVTVDALSGVPAMPAPVTVPSTGAPAGGVSRR
jgi:hypothetical protein